MDAVATLGGGALARTVSGFVPLGDTGLTGAAKGIGVAVAVGMVARRFLSSDTARFVMAGAMQVPIKNLITGFIPQAGAFLGDYDVGGYDNELIPGGDVGDYIDAGIGDDSEQFGSYQEAYG